jgi:hypothetical protein
MDFIIFNRRIIIGWNSEKTLKFGIYKEYSFTAIGLWPIIIGIGRKSGKNYGVLNG